MPPRKNYRKKKGLTKAQRAQVQKLLNKNIETKFRAQSIATTIDSTGTSYELCSVGTGDGQNNRSGHQLNVTGFYGKFQMVASDATNAIRVIMYIPKDPSVVMSGVSVYSLIDIDDYTILYDKLFTASINGINQRVFTIAKKFRGKGLQVQYSSTSATDFSKNALRMFVVSDSGAISHPTFNGHYRTYFKDA